MPVAPIPEHAPVSVGPLMSMADWPGGQSELRLLP